MIVDFIGEHAMPDQPHPFTGFAAGTPLLTPDGIKPIEDIKPGDIIQVQPDDGQGDNGTHAHEDDELRWWEWN
jgi:hypothetical protein